ncbi:hypothetical protein [Brevundimonas sp.]|uniref:hypothetical protein n=1 Tax=Brevundimonas sp. TaxID=1871086 RepID=UPI002B7298FB|nr:hypothetical protein [Brevundimonas sp.]HWQ88309.1 hypothetical protein [Brevundimonas sp.]
MRGSRASLTRVEREQEILRIAEALAQRGFYVFGPTPAAAAPTDPPGATPAPRGSPAGR